MTNVEMLDEMGKLGGVRLRMGAEDEEDESYDEAINKLSPQRVVEEYAAWVLGDAGWATDFIKMYLKLVNK